MVSRKYLGEFELVVLLALARLGRPTYGAAIHEEILRASGRDVSIPAVYVTLKRMEKKGYVTSAIGTSEDGGRATRDYALTRRGEDALEQSRALLEGMWSGIEIGAREESA